ncbi:hypothetical protein GMORB2_4894 [Geosmithia morbida]|uniref:Uncharacterized protein n=1 Tax=Geosmithia morbida TaxID=1094350 RepID=A0A9P5D0Z9_9HYPO|nr:uncharacterized protein GMORB2_4894 [Geosmithia morbida]KAF4119375.1 hypothetical protein GMORB2_4894 [Geosmithia morbida]
MEARPKFAVDVYLSYSHVSNHIDQDLDGYIQCVHHLNFSLRHLVPAPRIKSRPQTLSEGEESRATTSGRTSIVGKYYPHAMREWPDFDDRCGQSLARIKAALSHQLVFPSIINMHAMAREIRDELPPEFLGSESFLNEMTTSEFIHKTLQIPARRILNAGSMQTSGDNGEPGPEATARPPPKTQPDCYVLATDTIAPPGDVGDDDAAQHGFDDDLLASGPPYNVRRIGLAEHKALHRLRAATMAGYVDDSIPEDYMVFYARALTQAFHYMVSSGVEFGYMATGETLSFLRVPPEGPTTLLYHACLFPQYTATPSPAEGSGQLSDNEKGRLAVSMLSAVTLMALETTPYRVRRRGLNLSQLTRFPELPASGTAASSPGGRSASRKRRRGEGSDRDSTDDEGHRDDDDAHSASSNTRRRRRSSPLKKQRNVSDVEGGQRCAGVKRKRGGDGAAQLQRPAKPGLRSQRDPSTFRPIRPFCTQGCLRGLVHGEEMDPGCPNVLLHMQAASRDSRSLQASVQHALTLDELREAVQLQLLSNAEQDCDCMLERCLVGAIGCLFKITATGYGYTFVSKGVESFNSYRLLREVRVYERLAEQQGVTIPVCLGMVPLLLPYPMTNGALVTHMLLMSFAGLGLYSQRAQRLAEMSGADLGRESERTLRELEAVGLVESDDVNCGNLTWNRELQRVMKIDFDHASVSGSETLSPASKASPAASLGSSRHSLKPLGRKKARPPSGRRAWDDGERARSLSSLLRNARRSDSFIASLLTDTIL